MLSEKWRSMIIARGTPPRHYGSQQPGWAQRGQQAVAGIPAGAQGEPGAQGADERQREHPQRRQHDRYAIPREKYPGWQLRHAQRYELHRNRDEPGREDRSPQLPDTHAHGVLFFPDWQSSPGAAAVGG